MLSYVLSQKEEIEQYFQTRFHKSTLEPFDTRAREIFEKIGYNQDDDVMVKKLV